MLVGYELVKTETKLHIETTGKNKKQTKTKYNQRKHEKENTEIPSRHVRTFVTVLCEYIYSHIHEANYLKNIYEKKSHLVKTACYD